MITEHFPRVLEILTYDSSPTDIVLNYVALGVTLGHVVVVLRPLKPRLFGQRFWIPLTGFLFTFQIGLCMFDGCVGISIVWCAYCGFGTTLRSYLQKNKRPPADKKRSDLTERYWWWMSLSVSTALCVYYAVVEEPITTVAHGCAIVLGGAIGYLFNSLAITDEDGKEQR